jgi:hypothetical protein
MAAALGAPVSAPPSAASVATGARRVADTPGRPVDQASRADRPSVESAATAAGADRPVAARWPGGVRAAWVAAARSAAVVRAPVARPDARPALAVMVFPYASEAALAPEAPFEPLPAVASPQQG